MTLRRQLLTSRKNKIDIVSNDPKIEEHFANPANYADVVLEMFNKDRFYDAFFNSWYDLTVLDIGGNIGLFSLYIHDRARMVYPVEPTPTHFSVLTEMTKSYPNICPINVALHNRDEPIDFYISSENSTMNSSVNTYGTKTVVQGKRLKTLITDLGLSRVDFIKCDIEGSEMSALNDDTIAEVRDLTNVWSIEVHQTDHGISWAESIDRNRKHLTRILERNGFGVYSHRHDCLYAYKI